MLHYYKQIFEIIPQISEKAVLFALAINHAGADSLSDDIVSLPIGVLRASFANLTHDFVCGAWIFTPTTKESVDF